ncbi:type II toxin-antitoxin system PemK/MazF family toxin [Candidatus Saccharibacteria bacterium]|nr:type II toxin-antitoxin system PemK/MazF family toxin [Candidatus Saccharibacteria bacterium]
MPKNTNSHYKKHFDEWNKVKKSINRRAKVPTIHEGEIWWFADGQNIGVEIDGKGKGFARPVLVLTKFGKLSFLGIPLTTQKHTGSWYVEYDFQGKTCHAALHQAKAISVYRLYEKMGEMTRADFGRVLFAYVELHRKNSPLSSDRGVVGVPKDVFIIHRFFPKIKTFFRRFLVARRGRARGRGGGRQGGRRG